MTVLLEYAGVLKHHPTGVFTSGDYNSKKTIKQSHIILLNLVGHPIDLITDLTFTLTNLIQKSQVTGCCNLLWYLLVELK